MTVLIKSYRLKQATAITHVKGEQSVIVFTMREREQKEPQTGPDRYLLEMTNGIVRVQLAVDVTEGDAWATIERVANAMSIETGAGLTARVVTPIEDGAPTPDEKQISSSGDGMG